MKHLSRFLFVAVLLACNFVFVKAQQMPPLPFDPHVRTGTLNNGMTYYIRYNALPEKRAEFHIAQKVGSIQEEDNQRGLAHFLEHMCFNGTTHFPDNELRDYLESIGVKFGVDLNAYTSVDETVYRISNVPVIRDGVIDSCLLILHDWANDLLLEPEEIDKERGVIHEEWRSSTGAMMRMYERTFPIIYEGSKYAHRLPIGTMDVILNFAYQDLRDYYEKWYRPDLQGIIVVGDIDVDQMEEKIKALFSPIEMPENAAERIYFPVPDNKEPIITVEKDKEQENVYIYVFNKHETFPEDRKGSIEFLLVNYLKNMMSDMLNARLNELRQSPTPPFMYAAAYDGEFFLSKTKDAFVGFGVSQDDGIETATASILREMERVHRFGFTESEYARAKAEYLRQLESAYSEREKEKHITYAQEYIRHFLDNEPAPGIENEYALMNQIVPNIPVAAVNEMVKGLLSDSNLVVSIFCPEKEGMKYPVREDILRIVNEVKSENITAYEDKVSDEPLMAEKPQAGKIVSTKENNIFGSTLLTLSNGAKVYFKKTDFKADEVMLRGISFGGNSLFPDDEIININFLNDVVSLGGVGNFSRVDLDKVLAGKKAYVSTSVETHTERVNGSCSPKDFETMLQLLYLRFTAPRVDADAFQSYKTRTKAGLQNQEANPMTAFSDSLKKAIYQGHPRAMRMKTEMVDQIDYDKIMNMYKDRFANAGDFVFMLVGNIDLETASPLIEEYIASLPAIKRKESFKDVKMEMRKGMYKNEFAKELETPKATVLTLYNGNCPYTLENELKMSFLTQILNLIYTEEVREKEGGTYGVSVYGSLSKHPKEKAMMQIFFETSPDKREKMIEIILREADKMAVEGPSEANIKKAKEFMLKKYEDNQKENSYWLGALEEYTYTGKDKIKDYTKIVNSITPADIQKFAQQFLGQKNRIEVVMTAK